MVIIGDFNLWIFLLIIGQTSAVSYNQPSFNACTTWNADAVTFAANSTIGNQPYGIFINSNDTIYGANGENDRLLIWFENHTNVTQQMSSNLSNPYSIFVTINADIYVNNDNSTGQVDQWILNAHNSTAVMLVGQVCYGLFVDLNNTLYCSMRDLHQIIGKLLNATSDVLTVIAGTGCFGNASNMLNMPYGIFVNTNFDLYVADCGNNRIQKFESNQSNGTTIPGNMALNCPTGIVLDGDSNLLIVDSGNHRIIIIRSNGFTCLVGCSNPGGSAAYQLSYPQTMAFDSYGNIYVTDQNNNRIQKFIVNRVCEQSTIAPTTTQNLPEQSTAALIPNNTCRPPSVTLIPGISTLSSPIEFRRGQDFYIISIIAISCSNSYAMKNQWTVTNCTSVCSNKIQLDQTIITTFGELYIPAQTLAYGIYQLNLTVTMTSYPSLKSLASVYVRITPSGITANLVLLGTSMITSGFTKDLILNPGGYSADPDENVFNTSDWKYLYYCRIYGVSTFPTSQSSLLTIDDPRVSSTNESCFLNRADNQTAWKFTNPLNSSVTILGQSLQLNRTYQFMVYMENRRNFSHQATGYVLVKVEDTHAQMIAIGCVIWTMCVANMEFQRVNPTTQVALFALCGGNCTTIQSIAWNVYQGSSSSSSNLTIWTLFNQTTYQNIWFFGANTTNFTSTNQLFLSNSNINLWQFQVVYTFPSEASSSALNFIINQPPFNGSCSISPNNGTTSTIFTITCPNWYDEDGIEDYSVYTWTNDPSEQTIIAFSAASTFQVQLPAGDDLTSILHLIVHIRDIADCAAVYNLSAINVVPDVAGINDLLNNLQNPTNNPIVQLLASGDQNIVGQQLTSLSQQFNKVNGQSLNKAVSGGIPAASISISALGSQSSQGAISTSLNASAMDEYNEDLNTYANARDFLITFTSNLAITTSNSIKLQSSVLAQMTASTNQLTRAALTIASDRCYQLSVALYSISTQTSYEDVQIAATQLIQCATNVLSAVNGPLQQRTNVLDLDSSRATAIPDDYDTDLESPWSNLNLFADGNDFSWETIQKGRNSYYQNQLASQITSQVNGILSLITSVLKIQINVGQSTVMNTPNVYMSLETRTFQSLSNKVINQVGNSRIQLPSNFNSNMSDNSPVSIRSKMEPLASFGGNSKLQSNTNMSTAVSLSVFDLNGNDVPIQANSDNPIQIIIPRDPSLIISSMILQNVTSTNVTPSNQLFNLQYINITTVLSISVHFEIRPLNISLGYLFIYKFDQSPQLNSSVNQIDGWTVLCPSNLTNDSIYTYFIDNQKTSGHQSVIIGIRELNSTEMITVCSNSSIASPPITNQRFNFTSNYELRIYTSGCYYLDENNNWQSDGLIVGSLTNHNETHCFSTHLTTFVGGFLVLPEPVNWNYVFANAGFLKNKTIYLTVICVSVIYLALMIYARFKDGKDIEKLGVTPLPDNHKSDQYFYQIIVFTGQRKNAGTKSNVHFILSGNDDETHVRTFADPNRQVLQQGGIDAFIVAVPKSLGLLNCIRVWHDNTGKGSSSSWFLKYIIIRDLQTLEKFHFICQRWFAVEKDDGKIERVLPVAGVTEKTEFSYILSKQAYHSVSDGHLWFSIFSRPPSTKFTRVQRCTCCFVLLFLSMFLNIMYYDLQSEADTNNSTNAGTLTIGSVHITSEQISIGVIVELLALIPSLLLVHLFRRIGSRQKQIAPLHQALYKIRSTIVMSAESQNDDDEKKKKKKSPKTLPWWFIFIIYGLCVILVGVSIFFIIARGIEFGDSKTQKWLVSIISGFFSSVLLTQPLKILCFAIIFAFFCRNTDDDKEAHEHLHENKIDLENDEEYLHHTKNQSLFTYRPRNQTRRLNEAEIACARNQRLKEIHMWTVIQEALLYLCFLSVLSVITYSTGQTNSCLQVDHLRSYLLNSRQVDLDYTQISTVEEYWNWLENSFVDNIRAQQWYNSDPPLNLSGFINDKSNRLIGWVTMRQLRIKSCLCSLGAMNLTCDYDYTLLNEEKNSFEPGWLNTTTVMNNSTIQQAFQYKTSNQLGTYSYAGDHGTYGGGGYVYELRGSLSDIRSNISALHQLEWIDSRTRAIIIQLSLYNPNVELFTSVTFLTEFLSTGGIDPQSRFEPLVFYAYTSILQLVCIIIYMIFIIYFMIVELKLFVRLKWKYFREFWSVIELAIIICSWLGVGIYAWRYQEFSRIGELFKETNGYVYINLQLAAYINEFLIFIYGFCSFFGTVKFIRLCRFNSRLYLFVRTLQYAAKDIIAFTMMFSIVFVAFLSLFFLLFVSKLPSCATLLSTTLMLFEMTVMKYSTQAITGAAAFLGPFCFSLFIIVVVFICMNMFLSIINQSFRHVRANLNNDGDEIFLFMSDKFQRWIGLKKRTEQEIHEEQDASLRSEYFDPIEHFPDKVDQLLDALNRLYMTQRVEMSRLEKTVPSADDRQMKKEVKL